jgi:hypothetical protein
MDRTKTKNVYNVKPSLKFVCAKVSLFKRARGLLIALMIEAVSTSETSVNFYQTTRRDNPEDSHLHACSSENLKSHYLTFVLKLEINKGKRETDNFKMFVKRPKRVLITI